MSAEARSALGVSVAAAKLALNRLIKKGAIASPARGFYVTFPPEYRSIGCLPEDQFNPALTSNDSRDTFRGVRFDSEPLGFRRLMNSISNSPAKRFYFSASGCVSFPNDRSLVYFARAIKDDGVFG